MAASYVTPMLLLVGTSEANHFYNTKALDPKILIFGAMATGFLALFSNIPGLEPVLAGIAWVAFAGSVVAPIQSPSPAQNIVRIASGG